MNRRLLAGLMLSVAGSFAWSAVDAQAPIPAPVAQLSISEKPPLEAAPSTAPPALMPTIDFSPLTPREPSLRPESVETIQPAVFNEERKAVSSLDLDPPTTPKEAKKLPTPAAGATPARPTLAKEPKQKPVSPPAEPLVTRLPDSIEDCAKYSAHGKDSRACRMWEPWKLLPCACGAECQGDPCYEGHWQAEADAAFYTAAVRPQTQLAVRYDHLPTARLLDRAEYRWARADSLGRGPNPPPGIATTPTARWQETSLYLEAAAPHFGLILEIPYRSLDLEPTGHFAGFGDLKAGAKSMVLDTDILQIGLQMLAYIPTGSEGKGLGVGHASLEPSFLFGLRVTPSTFLQGQVAEWIPLSGDHDYAGAILHCHTSLNQVLWRQEHICLIATGEFQSWTFQDGAYTDPFLGGSQPASGLSYLAAGPGVRVVLGERLDFGVAAAFAINSPNFASQTYTAAFRWRF